MKINLVYAFVSILSSYGPEIIEKKFNGRKFDDLVKTSYNGNFTGVMGHSLLCCDLNCQSDNISGSVRFYEVLANALIYFTEDYKLLRAYREIHIGGEGKFRVFRV